MCSLIPALLPFLSGAIILFAVVFGQASLAGHLGDTVGSEVLKVRSNPCTSDTDECISVAGCRACRRPVVGLCAGTEPQNALAQFNP